jgi:hypothetical protein
MIKALSLHPWLNTPAETKRPEAARAAMENWKSYSHACQARHNAHRLHLSRRRTTIPPPRLIAEPTGSGLQKASGPAFGARSHGDAARPESAVSGPCGRPFRRVHSVRWRSRLAVGASRPEEATQIIDRG